jgi:uncharacterized protein (TIGR02646 family)
MVRQRRKSIAEPKSLVRNATRWTTDLVNARTSGNKKAITDAEGKYKKHDVKTALSNLFHSKCAYCESIVDSDGTMRIDHFRPKSKYPKKCFSWNNLLPSCEICNSTEYKGNNFPTKQDGGPFIDPCVDNPDKHFTFVFDPVTSVAYVTPITKRGRTTELTIGLNRPNLLRARSRSIRKFERILAQYFIDPQAMQIVDDLINDPTTPFLAFIRVLAKQAGVL